MILGDDKAVVPANVDQGYVLRKFIRRSIRQARLLGIQGPICEAVSTVIVKIMGQTYSEIEKNKEFVFRELIKEEEKFSVALTKGTEILEKKLFFLEKANKKELNGKGAFDLYQSFGFPLEMTIEMCKEKGFSVDANSFNDLVNEHKNKSRIGAEQKFKGGLADNKEETTALHTVTHLTLAAMKKIVSEDIEQKGANINADRLRLDFNSEERLTDEQLRSIEDYVNTAIKSEAIVTMDVMDLAKAKESGAHGVFDSKYGEKVKVYTITDKAGTVYSKEICGGPHVETLKGIGAYKIKKQESVAAGIKRIKAVLE